MRIFVILFLLSITILVQLSPQEYVTDINGFNWVNWTLETRQTFLLGFTLGTYTSQQVFINMQILTYEDYKSVEKYLLNNHTVQDLILEIEQFYAETQRFDYPLYYVVYARNAWKNRSSFPEWSEIIKNSLWR